nr:MAG TPA: hypothetical protein [Caudoviricetes sp.]
MRGLCCRNISAIIPHTNSTLTITSIHSSRPAVSGKNVNPL